MIREYQLYQANQPRIARIDESPRRQDAQVVLVFGALRLSTPHRVFLFGNRSQNV